MEKKQRDALGRAVVKARFLLEEDFREQLEGTFNILPDGKVLDDAPGDPIVRRHLVQVIEHHKATGESAKSAVARLTREMAFTTLNRFAALKIAERRGIVRECVSQGLDSAGIREFAEVAPGLKAAAADGGYRLLLEALMDEISLDLKALFDRRDAVAQLWPRPKALDDLLKTINGLELTDLWSEDEAIGWIYQYFNADDVDKMRKKSSVPRNSRELAVRNQFFTPRYVVEFLTDNTLGRTWYDMRQGDTALREQCRYLVRRPAELFLSKGERPPDDAAAVESSRAEALKTPAYVRFRERKDPRDIRVLDPAVGSGHFLLYAFDLLLTIYEEAWYDSRLPFSEITGTHLREDYVTAEALKHALPQLILKHNLYGIEIDVRCAQIASLALWLRAQRAWAALCLDAAERPSVTRTNIVVAEPIPGDESLIEAFAESLDPPELGIMFRKVVKEMESAAELGSLLRIEESIERIIDETKKTGDQGSLWGTTKDSTAFWRQVARHLLRALQDFASQVERLAQVRGRLFRDDAAHGVALAVALGMRYDVVLMNPPFGAPVQSSGARMKVDYPESAGDVLAAFVMRAQDLAPRGRIGAITSRTVFYLPTFSEWRRRTLFGSMSLATCADLGANVLDGALVEAFAVTIDSYRPLQVPSFRLNRTPPSQKGAVLAEICRSVEAGVDHQDFFLPRLNDLLRVDGHPLVYGAASQLRHVFDLGVRVAPDLSSVEQGLSTKNDFRFLRLAVEVPPKRIAPDKWGLIAKGGEYRPYYDDIYLVVNAHNAFGELKADLIAKYPYLDGNTDWVLHPEAQYLVGGLTFPERTTSAFGPRVLPRGCYFSHVGLAIITGDAQTDLALLAWLLSRPVQLQVELQVGSADAVESGSAARHYSMALVSNLHIPDAKAMHSAQGVVEEAVRLTRELYQWDELARTFVGPAQFAVARNCTLNALARMRYEQREVIVLRVLEANEKCEQIADSAFQMDGASVLDDEVRRRPWLLPDTEPDLETLREAMESPEAVVIDTTVQRLGFHRSLSKKTFIADRRLELTALLCGSHPTNVAAARKRKGLLPADAVRQLVCDLLSYAVGVVFGRWDIRVPFGTRELRSSVFASLPPAPPGMLVETDPGHYPINISSSGFVVDGLGASSDLLRAVRTVLDVIWGDGAQQIEEEACSVLGVKELGQYFGRMGVGGFFDDHVRRYSRSRRKAPIYWPLSIESGAYIVWIYYPRLYRDILYRIVTEHVAQELGEVAERVVQCESEQVRSEGREAAKIARELGDLRAFHDDLEAFKVELLRVAELPYRPDLDDGVQISAAPLWRFFRHRQWQGVLKNTWQELEQGKYDWAHLACAIWPDRVREKCKADRSLAIAHDLEELYVEQPAKAGSRSKRR